MPKTRISCPNCRQPVVADIDQLFDTAQSPDAKQRLLSGAFNMIDCPVCGYRGNASTILVYHDPDKELLLTYVPPEMGLPMNEQERLTGALINQVFTSLPQEKRKGYLLRPQPVLTLQGMIERILAEDGITREMIQAQQQKLNLIQRFASMSSPQALDDLIKQEDAQIDKELINLLHMLAESAQASGDQPSAERLAVIQNRLLEQSTVGKEMLSQAREIEAAMTELQQAGNNLTREKLLNFVINASSEVRLQAYVSLARPGMDYQFFQLLSERIDRARGDGKNRLVELRNTLLQLTQEFDQQLEARMKAARQLLDQVLQSEDVSKALMDNANQIDDFFMQVVNSAQQDARKKGDLERSAKIQAVIDVLQSMSETPAEVKFLEELLEVADDPRQEETWRNLFDSHAELITPEFVSALANIATQVEQNGDEALTAKMDKLNRFAIRYAMLRNLA